MKLHQVQNFFLTHRVNNSSRLEKVADVLLTPARELFGGKLVVDLKTAESYVFKIPKSSNSWKRAALKIIAVATLPIASFGAFLKTFCLIDSNYKEFCTQKLPKEETDPKLYKMFQHVYFTKNFVERSANHGIFVFKPLDLSAGVSNRLINRINRLLEDATVQRLADIIEDKTQNIKLLSMGGHLSGFLTVEKLVLAGFKNITLDCIESNRIEPDKVERMQPFFKDCKDIKITINSYTNVNDLSSKDYDAILALDYNGVYYPDYIRLKKAEKLLNQNGFLALGGYINTLRGPNMKTITLTDKCITRPMTNDFSYSLPKKESLSILLTDHNGCFSFFIEGIALAVKEAGHTYKQIDVYHIEEERDPIEIEWFQEAISLMFPNSKVTVSRHEDNKKYDLFLKHEFFSKDRDRYFNFVDQATLSYFLQPNGTIHKKVGNQKPTKI